MWLCSGTYSRVTGISRFARQEGVMSYLLFWTAMGLDNNRNSLHFKRGKLVGCEVASGTCSIVDDCGGLDGNPVKPLRNAVVLGLRQSARNWRRLHSWCRHGCYCCGYCLCHCSGKHCVDDIHLGGGETFDIRHLILLVSN